MKNNRILVLIASCFFLLNSYGQKYLTQNGEVEIYSKTDLFLIDGKNVKVTSILDAASGDVGASLVIRSFKFDEAQLEEHFNENYMSSHLFPKAEFKGKITNISSVNFSKDGTYPIQIEGVMEIHGKKNPMKADGKIVVKRGTVKASTKFNIAPKLYNVKVEEKYKDRIKDNIQITVNFDYQKMK